MRGHWQYVFVCLSTLLLGAEDIQKFPQLVSARRHLMLPSFSPESINV
jgi:hypothetical protein